MKNSNRFMHSCSVLHRLVSFTSGLRFAVSPFMASGQKGGKTRASKSKLKREKRSILSLQEDEEGGEGGE